MTEEELFQLTQPVSEDNPCGDDLSDSYEYLSLDDSFGALSSESKPSIVEGELAGGGGESGATGWRTFREDAIRYLRTSKHVGISVYLCLAELNLFGPGGLRDGLSLTRQLLESFWDGIYPRADVPEGGAPDYDGRLTFFQTLNRGAILVSLKDFPLTDAAFGSISFREAQRIESEGSEEERAGLPVAFEKSAPEKMDAIVRGVAQALEEAQALEQAVNRLTAEAIARAAGAEPPGSIPPGPLRLEELTGLLGKMKKVIDRYNPRPVPEEEGAEGLEGAEGAAGAAAGPARAIRNQQDIIDRLDEICRHYQSHEPTSPVPYLLRRAKRVVKMNFHQIVEEFRLTGDPPIDAVLGSLEEERSDG